MPIEYVDSYGAVADGVTDDYPALLAAYNALPATGGTVVFGARTYRLGSYIDLDKDNVTFDFGGATIVKQPSDHFDVIIARSFRGTGYGAGAKNTTIKNGKFKGSFQTGALRGIGMHFHHVEDLTVDNVHFVEALMGGHNLDIAGAKNVKIFNSIFEGAAANPAHNEAIQLDYSYLVGTGIDDADRSRYDGLGTRDVVMENNQFIPLSYQVNGLNYPAPNPFGSHTRLQNGWVENVIFTKNLVEGGASTGELTGTTRGWIHFLGHVRDMKITQNTFIAKSGVASMVIHINSTTGENVYGNTPAQLQDPLATQTVVIRPQCASEIDVSENTFIGFNAADTEPIIHITGHATQGIATNISVTKNKFRSCHPTNANTPTSQLGCDLYYVHGVIFNENQSNAIGQILHTVGCVNVSVETNRIRSSFNELFFFSTTNQISFVGNGAQACSGGVRFNGGTSISCVGNTFRMGSATNRVRANVIELSGGVSGFVVSGNIVENPAGYEGGIISSGTCVRGVLVGNVAPVGQSGTALAGVDVQGTPANVIAVNNVSA